MVSIPVGRTVTYNVESTAHIKAVHYMGTFKLARDRDLALRIETIYGPGELDFGTPQDPIPESATPGKPRARITFEAHTLPGSSPKYGLMTMGKVRIHGAPKLEFGHVVREPRKGDTSIRIREDVSTWRVGEKIIVHGTAYAGRVATDPFYTGPMRYWFARILPNASGYAFEQPSTNTGFTETQDEERTITAVDVARRRVSFAEPLQFDHRAKRAQLPHGQVRSFVPLVSNMSRSVKFDCATPLGERPHMMYMHHPDVHIRYREAQDIGRTRSDATLTTHGAQNDNGVYAYTNNTKGAPLADNNNVRGRYGDHFHRMGAYIGVAMASLIGCTLWSPRANGPLRGWGMVQHSSRCTFERNVVYNCRGAGMVSENGDEIGQWADNVVSWCRGDGFDWRTGDFNAYGHRQEEVENHNGSSGVAFENQARQILLVNNWAFSCRYGFLYHQQNVNMLKRIPDAGALRLRDPVTAGGMNQIHGYGGIDYGVDSATYGIEQAQIPDSVNNFAVACDIAWSASHRQFHDRADKAPLIMRGFIAINCNITIDVASYSFMYSYYDTLATAAAAETGKFTLIGTKSFGMMWVNAHVEGFDKLLDVSELNYEGYAVDIATKGVPRLTSTGHTFGSSSKFYDVMGDASGSSIRIHRIHSMDEFPLPYPREPLGIQSDPQPGQPLPRFWLDPSSTTEIRENSINTFSYKGVVVDSAGIRRYPDTMISTNNNSEKEIRVRENYYATGKMIVERNGCYEASPGNWRVRAWHVDHDRLTGGYMTFPVELQLTGTWNQSFLQANRVDPSKTNPIDWLPLKLEQPSLAA